MKCEIAERTRHRAYRFKTITLFYCTYGDEVFLDETTCERAIKQFYCTYGDEVFLDEIRTTFQMVLCTRSARKLDEFVAGLGRSDADMRLKRAIKEIREKYLF